MESLVSKIRALLPKMHFLDQEVLKNIESSLDQFSQEKLERLYEMLSDVHQKTMNHFETLLKNDPRFFEHAKLFMLQKKESASQSEDQAELQEVENILETI